jgi:hypothetical protein
VRIFFTDMLHHGRPLNPNDFIMWFLPLKHLPCLPVPIGKTAKMGLDFGINPLRV